MIDVECPWCAGSATVGSGDSDEFSCAGCAIRIEIARDPVVKPFIEPVARAA